jgi:hypothetical protein
VHAERLRADEATDRRLSTYVEPASASAKAFSVDSIQVELIVEVSPGPSNESFVMLMLRVPWRL